MAPVKLFHYTNWLNCVGIMDSGEIRRTESHIGSADPKMLPCGEHVGPDVVWLTTKSTATANGVDRLLVTLKQKSVQLGCPMIALDKTQVRLTVEIPDDEVHSWPEWAKAHGIHGRWQMTREKNQAPWCWRIAERAVRSDEIVDTRMTPELAASIKSGRS
jgi:hypothetical protein